MRTVLVLLFLVLVVSGASALGFVPTLYEGVVLARVVASEDTRVLRDRQPDCKRRCGTSGTPTSDAHAIAEVVMNNRARFPRAKSYLEVMQKLAPHVTGAVPISRERQQWTSTLPAHGKVQPKGWVTERDGDWRSYAENWSSFRDEFSELWIGQDFKRVTSCETPIMWGNEDDYQNNKHWLCRCECTDCINVIAARRSPRDRGCVSDTP